MAFLTDGGRKAVAGMHDGVVRECEEFGDEGVHNFFRGATPKVGAANAAREERVACEEDWRGDGDFAGVGRKKKAGTAGRVAGGVNHLGLQVAPLQRVAFAQELVHVADGRRLDAKEARLHFHGLIERNIVAMHQNGSAGVVVEFLQAADVVNVSVGADDGFDGEFMAAEQIHDAVNFVAGIENNGFTRNGIADDGAVALQQPDGNGEVQQSLTVLRGVLRAILCTASIRHSASIALGRL